VIFYQLLDEFEKLTGLPLLLNTSLNDNGKPIISNVEDAYSMLPSLDGIVVNGVLITK
jgi:carbamoyltransferase